MFEQYLTADIAEGRIRWIEDFCVNPVDGSPIVLADFQKDIIRELYAGDTTVLYYSISRGNAKTTLAAFIALAELFINPDAPMVCLYLPFVDQAAQDDGIFGICKTVCRLQVDVLPDHTIKESNGKEGIKTAHNRGTLKAIAIKSTSRLLGGRPTLMILDEAAAEEFTQQKVSNIRQGLGKRDDARMLLISTPVSSTSAFALMRSAIEENGLPKGTKWHELSAKDTDDFSDEDLWRRLNPGIDAGFLGIETLREEWNDPMITTWQFQMYRLGMHTVTDVGAGWLGLDGAIAWDACVDDSPHLPDLPIFLGVDKAKKGDSCGVTKLQKRGIYWHAHTDIYLADPKKQQFQIDHAQIRDDILRYWQQNPNVQAVGFDPMFFIEHAADLAAAGVPMREVPQNRTRLTVPYQVFGRAIMDRQFFHPDDKLYRSHVLGAVMPIGSDLLDKNKSTKNKIDAAVATGIAFAVALNPEPEKVQFDQTIYLPSRLKK